ncbi:MAG: kynureninase [Sphingomicrobium sp.]
MTFLDDAKARDSADPLAYARERFRLPEGVIYLDGNSLGAMPAATPARLAEVAEREWGGDLIASWNKHHWIDAPHTVAARLAPILGAQADELLIAESTSINLFKLIAAAIRARPGRTTILTETGNFPTDRYIADGAAELLGLEVRAVAPDALAGAIGSDTALVTLTQIDYRSSARRDMAAINSSAKAAGALNLWDLSHSAGALRIDLNGLGCDLAVGCGYKYLNGGPGAPAYLFVAKALQEDLANPLPGWLGHADPFAFADAYAPAAGIRRFLSGTPSIIALAALDCGLATFEGVAMDAVEAKAGALGDLFIASVEQGCGDPLRLQSPRESANRGSHVSFAHPQAYAVMQALIEQKVIGDFRAPDLLRFGFAPLYNCFEDAVRAAEILTDILTSGSWDQPKFHQRAPVT